MSLRFRTKHLWIWAKMIRLRAWLAFAVALAAASIAGMKVRHYVADDPRFCSSCHVEAAGAAAKHAHRHVACQKCHRTNALVALKLYVGSWFGKTQQLSAHGQPDRARCKTCHLEGKGRTVVTLTGGHSVHVVNGPHLGCVECHELRGHSTELVSSACQRCHKKVGVHDRGMAKVGCLDCHDFLAPVTSGRPIPATGCPKCHGGSPPAALAKRSKNLSRLAITSKVIHGNVNACRLCHDPHSPDLFDRHAGTDCDRCHRGVVQEQQGANIPGHPDCSICHEVHGPRPKTPELCVRCHDDKGPSAATSTLANRHQQCSKCHKAHTFEVTRDRCAACHDQERTKLASWKSTRHSDCLSCHRGHQDIAPAQVCPTCHKPQRLHAHPACTTCHDPHLGKSGARSCVKCHSDVAATVGKSKASGHRNCSSCHATHAPASAPSRCAGCHQQQGALAKIAGPPPHQSCVSCHRPHQFQASAVICKTCHEPAELTPHKDACLRCHQPHGPPASAQLVCNSCHTQVQAISGKHANCQSCHSPHKLGKSGPQCADCHAQRAAAVRSWAPAPHQSCQTCHARHSPMPPKNCGQCHAAVTSKTLSLGHRCTGCHNPHQPQTDWWGKCANCHANEAAATATMSGTHSQCRSCHTPHSAGLPSCRGCHSNPPGAHSKSGHKDCKSCHSTHSVRVTGRAVCTKCHQDKVNHYPKAAQCFACHLFQ